MAGIWGYQTLILNLGLTRATDHARLLVVVMERRGKRYEGKNMITVLSRPRIKPHYKKVSR